LTDEMFATRLKDVVEGTADPVYGAAARFFDNTFFRMVREYVRRGELPGQGLPPARMPAYRTEFRGARPWSVSAIGLGNSHCTPTGFDITFFPDCPRTSKCGRGPKGRD
jgi:hypothetical protein